MVLWNRLSELICLVKMCPKAACCGVQQLTENHLLGEMGCHPWIGTTLTEKQNLYAEIQLPKQQKCFPIRNIKCISYVFGASLILCTVKPLLL